MSDPEFTAVQHRPCKKCGCTERTKQRACKQCHKISAARNQREKPEMVAARMAKWRQKNLEKIKASNANWYKKNPMAARIYSQNRRERKQANGGGFLSNGLAEKLFILQKGKCACCGKPLGKKYHMDHVMPLALGGPNTDENIQLLTQSCNSQKRAKHPVDFMQSRGFLL